MFRLFLVAVLAATSAIAAHAQTTDAPGPVGGVPAALPELKLPDVRDAQMPLPRPVQATQAALGLGRQRLGLVLGLGTVGRQAVLDHAGRDARAMAAALRAAGYVVMQREDVGAAELRAALQEFRTRLQPGGMGFVYVVALGAQVQGANLLLPRDAPLADVPAAALPGRLQAAAVPLSEVVDALQGTADSPRLLVVDAAWRHPALLSLPAAGLAEQRLPPGVMALFGHGLQAWKELPAVAPLPTPAPTDPRELAASGFATALVNQLLVPRAKGPDALRATRRAIEAQTLGQDSPWLSGDTDSRDEFAESTMLDALIPRSPEDFAREGARQGSRLLSRHAPPGPGEQSVAEVLNPGGAAPDISAAAPPAGANRVTLPEQPRTTVAGGAVQALGAAATVAGLAGTAAAGAAAVKAAQAQVLASTATTAADVAAGTVGGAAKLAARALDGGGGGVAKAAAASPAAAMPATVPATAPAAVPAAAAPLAVAPGAQRGAAAAPVGGAPVPPAPDGRTRRVAEGGERPVYVPRHNDWGIAEGDTYTWQVLDLWRDEFVRRNSTAIEEVLPDGRLLANGGQMALDAQGRIVRMVQPDGSVHQFQPAQELWWLRPRRGESRQVAYTETFQRGDRVRGTTEWNGSASVGRPRKLELPAGEFEAVPIESSGWWTETLSNGTRTRGAWSRTVWVSPRLGQPVAIDIEDTDPVGKRLRKERVELLHAQTQSLDRAAAEAAR